MNEKVYNVYCDESRVTSDNRDEFMVIGGVSIPLDQKYELFGLIDRLKGKYHVQEELGWKSISTCNLPFYLELLDLFFNTKDLNFRCVVVNRNNNSFPNTEVMFQKTYYQVFNHWLINSNKYRVFIDRRIDDPNRVPALRKCIINTWKFGDSVLFIEEVESSENNLIQLADLLIGAVGYSWNNRTTSNSKLSFCNAIAEHLNIDGLSAYTTPPFENKFNVFKFGA